MWWFVSNTKKFRRNEKIKIMKMLRALNYIYSLRQLESILDIPYQNLWKYIHMLTIPSDEVVIDIISKLSEGKLIEKTINDMAKVYRDKIHDLASDIGFLSLYIFKIEDILRDVGADIVLPISENSIPFATILAWELGLKMCLPIFESKVGETKVKVIWYISNTEREVKLFITPSTCLEKTNTILVTITLDDVDKLKAVLHILKQSDSEVKAIVTIYITKECLDYIKNSLPQALVTYIVVV